MFAFLRWLIALPLVLVFPARIRGLRNLHIRKGGMLVCNHTSYADPFVLAAYTLRPIHFVAKSEFFENRAFGRLLYWLGAFPIKRDSADIKAIKQCIKVVKQNKVLGIFPEGTSKGHTEGMVSEMKRGVALIALKSRVPITPVLIAKKARPFRIQDLRAGAPFTLDDLYDKRLTNEVLDEAAGRIMAALNGQGDAR